MPICNPVLRLDDLNRIQHGFLDPWEIDVQPKESIVWSILLAFLKRDIRKSEEKLAKLVICLNECLGDAALNLNMDNMKRGLLVYNPFLNIHSCFYDDGLKLLVKLLIGAMHAFIREKTNNKYFHSISSSDGHNIPINNETMLQAFSVILNCKIFVVCDTGESNAGDTTVSEYPRNLRSHTKNGRITLYQKENAQITFKFGMSKISADSLQEIALQKILQPQGLITDRRQVQQMVKYPHAKSNLLISLLENKRTPFIRELYRQPPHILKKVSEAGFNLDPSKESMRNGYSINAFVYVLVHNDIETLYLLYSYAPYHNCGSPRHPTGDVIVHLENLSEALLKTQRIYQKQFAMRERGLIYIEELLRLHSFQFKVSKKIFEIINEQYHEYLYILSCEVKKQKRIVLSILDEYIDYFYMNESCTNTADSSSVVERYTNFFTYRNFFRKLDLMSGLFFFDKIFSLKEHLRMEHDHYDKIESSFVRLAFINSTDIFDVRNYKLRFSKFEKDRLEKTIEHLSRVEFEDHLQNFRDLLSPFKITDKNITKHIPPTEIYTLTTELDIRDHMFIHRLKQYMTIATEDVDLSRDFEIGVLIIQRAIQVLGESVHIDVDDAQTLAKSLLASCLPTTATKMISELRDLLSDYPVNQIFCIRQKFEKEISMFTKIQEELRKINDKLKPIYLIQNSRIQKYLCQKKLEMFKKFQRGLRKTNNQRQNLIFDMLRSGPADILEFGKISNELQTLNSKKQELRLQKRVLLSGMSNTTKDFNKLLRQHARVLVTCLERHILWIQNVKKTKIRKEQLKSIQRRFKCIEHILSFLLNELCQRKKLKTELLKSIQIGYDALTLSDDMSTEVLSMLDKYKTVKPIIFQAINFNPTSDPIEEDSNYNAIYNFSRVLKGFSVLFDSDMKKITSNVPRHFIEDSEKLTKICEALQLDPLNDVSELILQLSFTRRKKEEIIDIWENQSIALLEGFVDKNDPYKTFTKRLAQNSLAKAHIESYCEIFEFSAEIRQILEEIKEGKDKRKEDKALEFLSDRVHKLYRFLIESDKYVLRLHQTAKSPETKTFMVDIVVRQFMKQPKLQAAIEFLLCDCMLLLKTKTDLRHLWIKMNDLFYGITFRNVLAHGNPLFEAVVQFFDPGDLPNEIVNKAMELIEDIECIDSLCELHETTRFSYEDLKQLIDSDDEDIYREMITKIKQCSKWDEYVALVLPGRARPTDVVKSN